MSIRIGYLQLPPVSIALLALLIAASAIVRKVFGERFAFTKTELAVVYIMSLIAAMVSSHGLVQKWLPLLVAPHYFATSANGWNQLYGHMPKWIVAYRPLGAPMQSVATYYYEGLPRSAHIPWQAWVMPVSVTGFLVLSVVAAFLFLTALLRRQWVDHEKLSFPLARLPLEMIGDHGGVSFFRNPLTWVGIAIPIVYYGIDWIHQLDPTMPLLPTAIALNSYLTTPPLNSLAYTPFVISFAAVGFFFLLPSDILFSIWFFFVLSRVEQVVAYNVNMDQPGMPMYPSPMFVGYQTMGAYFVLVAYLLAVAKPHLRTVWHSIRHGSGGHDAMEMCSYRFAFWGLCASLLCAVGTLTFLGMSWWLAAFELLVFVFVIAVVMARSTVEAGMLMTETTFRPIDVYRMVGSVHSLGPANLTLLAFVDNLLLRDQRGLLLTGFLDSSKIMDGVGGSRRVLSRVIVTALICGLLVAIPLQIALPYVIGGLKMDAWMMRYSPLITFNDYQSYFAPGTIPVRDPWQMSAFFIVGALVTITLASMRSAFYWWPLHPLGYALSGAWSTVEFWFPCLIAWIAKSFIMRYFGVGVYRRILPMMLGMIVGEFGMAVLSVTINILFHLPPPSFPWG